MYTCSFRFKGVGHCFAILQCQQSEEAGRAGCEPLNVLLEITKVYHCVDGNPYNFSEARRVWDQVREAADRILVT